MAAAAAADVSTFDAMFASWVHEGNIIPGDVMVKILQSREKTVPVPAKGNKAATTATVKLGKTYKFSTLDPSQIKKVEDFWKLHDESEISSLLASAAAAASALSQTESRGVCPGNLDCRILHS